MYKLYEQQYHKTGPYNKVSSDIINAAEQSLFDVVKYNIYNM